jgi:hypothetical protein
MTIPDAIWYELHPAPARAAAPLHVTVATAPSGASKKSLLFVLLVVALPLVGTGAGLIFLIIGLLGASATSLPSPSPTSTSPVAAAGEPCKGRRAACATDGKADLVCGPGDKMVVEQTCKGPGACRASPDGASITCDATLGEVHDPCNITDDACSTDHKSELHCQAGRFAVIASCKGPDGCTLSPAQHGQGYTLSCDDHVADVGDPCFDAERTACSSDKKSLLTCTAHRFVVHRTCRRACMVKKLVGTENMELDCE